MSKTYQGLSYAALLLLTMGTAVNAQGVLSATPTATNGTSVNLTTEGAADWSHWGYIGVAQDHKAVSGTPVGLISDETVINGGTAASQYSDNGASFSWTDGTPTATATNTTTGIYQAGGAFQFTVPADTTSRTLKVYLGGYQAGTQFTASLSDGSAPDYNDSSLSPVNATFSPDGNHFYAVYAVTYKAASAGQTLTINYAQTVGSGNVTLQAATLFPTPTTAPAAPTSLVAIAGTNRVGLSWNGVTSPGVTGYNIKRNTAATGTFTTIGTVTTPGYQDTTAVNGTTYYYEVTALNAAGESTPSNVASAMPQDGLDGTGLTGNYYNDTGTTGYGPAFNYAAAPTPDATEVDPTINLNVDTSRPAGVNHDDFNAQWTGRIKAQVTGPYVFTTTSDDGSRVFIDGNEVVNNYAYQASTTVSSAPVTLTAGSLHTIRVDYFQGGGGGPGIIQFLWAYPGQPQQLVPAYALFPTFGNSIPVAPTISGVGGDRSAILTFTQPENATSFTLLRSLSATGPFSVVSTTITGSPYVDSGLTNGTTYYYEIEAVNANGTSPVSNVAAVTPVAGPALIAEEEFNYPAGPLNGLNGGIGWGGAWGAGSDAVQTTGLSFNGLTSAGGAAVTSVTGDSAFRSLAARQGSYLGTETIYLSYLAALDPANTATIGPNSSQYNGISLFDDGSENFFTGLTYNGTDYGSSLGDAGVIVDGTIHFFVFKFDFTATGVTVNEYIDPAAGSTLPATANLTGTVGAFSFNRIRIGNGNGNPSALIDYDEIRFGSTYAAVSPVAGATVTGNIALEGVPNLAGISPAAPLGTFHIGFRAPGAATETFGKDVTLTTAAGSPNGSFTATGVPDGTYDVTIEGAKNLRVLLPNVTISGATGTLANVTLPAGDANGDNSVDTSDFSLLVGSYGGDSSVPGSGYDPAEDFNFDGVVDTSDFSLLVGEYGNVGAP